jgi:hypothetical protein
VQQKVKKILILLIIRSKHYYNENFIDYSSSDCEGQIITGDDHGISIDKCFGNKVSRQNEITDYLKSINF